MRHGGAQAAVPAPGDRATYQISWLRGDDGGYAVSFAVIEETVGGKRTEYPRRGWTTKNTPPVDPHQPLDKVSGY